MEAARPRAIPAGAPKRDVTVALEAAGPARASLRLQYQSVGASWLPAYDARLTTGNQGVKPALDLVRRALVQQRTGEDWSDVELSVSTVRALRRAAAPDLPPLQAAFVNVIEIEAARARSMAAQAAPAPKAAAEPGEARGRRDAAAEAAAQPIQEQAATLEAGAYGAVFRIPGRVSLPQDGAQKGFRIGSRRVEPALSVRAVPALDPSASVSYTHLPSPRDS